ncbi:Facilitated trehalose transporter Tret1 [Amphibalanus amphitrite]|uniref:Facilitated trehalose transporter Tret1 n=1 Tax=Amphibalanus amphitrite TaxID=1232801 RepID=A0A6A4VH05_AMPAM|nr:Facilitated trehalose transporter Tret1 [Amphibalanus amphitrite]
MDSAERCSKRGLLMQVLTAVSLSTMGFNLGASQAFTGVFTEQMTSARADLALTRSQISWVAAIFAMGNMSGFLMSSYANPRLGTVRIVQLCAPVVAAGWLVLALGNSFWTVLAGRALTGVGIGTSLGPTITHIGEITSVNLRGVLAIFINVMISIGMLSIFLSGWLMGWRHACLAVGIGPILLMFVVTLVLPRSAKWIISKGHPEEEAQRSLHFYHGKDYDVHQQIQSIRESLGDEHRHDASLLQVLSLLRHRHNLVPFGLMLGIYTFFVFSGGFTTASFAPVIFKDVGGFSNPYIGSILLGVLRVVASVVASIVIRKCERNSLLFINSVVGGAACLISGFFFFYSAALADYAWVSLVSVLVIVGTMSLGIAPLTNVLLTELLPNAVRAELGGILLLYYGTDSFAMVYCFPLVADSVGMASVFWFFALMQVLMAAFAKLCLPHTNGKSIEEIQKLFVKNITNVASDPIHLHAKMNKTNGGLAYQTFQVEDLERRPAPSES